MRNISSAILSATLVLTLSGCVTYSEESLYSPGGALADKAEGPVLLSTATAESINAMFPAGKATQGQVQAALSRPQNVSQSSDGTTVEIYSYTFTSYKAQRVDSSTLSVVYDPQRIVKETRLMQNQNRW